MERVETQLAVIFRNRGNQRLWLLLSITWIFIAGWLFWKPLPDHKPVDVSQEASAFCISEESADVYAAGEKAFQACLKRRNAGSSTASQSLVPGLTNESLCNLERDSTSINYPQKAESREIDCELSKTESLQKDAQHEADIAVDSARSAQLTFWAAKTFLSPLLIPISVILLAYILALLRSAANWIRDGYSQ
jgi:hypothetical protein